MGQGIVTGFSSTKLVGVPSLGFQSGRLCFRPSQLTDLENSLPLPCATQLCVISFVGQASSAGYEEAMTQALA